MFGYLINSKIRAFIYTIFHHKGLAMLIYLSGINLSHDVVKQVENILFSHAALYRVFGFGLKYASSPKDTQLASLNKIDEN